MTFRPLASIEALIPRIERREARALGRAISIVESGASSRSGRSADGDPHPAGDLIGRLYPQTGNARIVGVTGPPGAGKSTLVDRLARRAREQGQTVAILAIDPTSPFTGGALLGDRIRMQELYTDPEVFIRSMATRGAMGGLASATHDAVDILDAAGFDLILLETVGVGQDEVDVVRSVDTVVVLAIPGMGDDIQASKAGVLEIADLYVINKADRPGADRVVKDLHWMLHLSMPEIETSEATETGDPNSSWRPPVVKTIASTGEGIDELAAAIDDHSRYLRASGALADRRRRRFAMRVEHRLRQVVLEAVDGTRAEEAGALELAVDEALRKTVDPYRVADSLLGRLASVASSSDES